MLHHSYIAIAPASIDEEVFDLPQTVFFSKCGDITVTHHEPFAIQRLHCLSGTIVLGNSISRETGSVAVNVYAKVANVVHCVHAIRDVGGLKVDNSCMPFVRSEGRSNIRRSSLIEFCIVREC